MGTVSLSEMQNPSCLLYGPFDARFEDRPIPQIEDPSDVIIRIAYTGVCGSDVRLIPPFP
jgi:D-xylulose reductase